ncbi:type IV pilus twitching motility protein PilT [Candidatus Peregrinibacteria bacterium]|jgi:twitching motility protein PilT|nr:type IV pilus twitching motility protein PilT [Candidatus Peregrinibacteria bacterium]MBT4632300.1 type IV pilus twitching motility protein PilT [Candidatus Peregrinibacteria bacterium]MBT5516884.1 type IV pilus twitching motility protein PilT [Candidatus Peregrinibacteria bacterium]MBT5824289.1 type IV pilus twitching motility protein PilT [Candidatus Peregrinibacteria bacterium]
MDINNYLKEIVTSGAPDLHLKVGRVPIVRIANGELYEMENAEEVTLGNMEEIVKQVLSEEKHAQFTEHGEIDGAYSILGAGRFRVNVYRETEGIAIAFRSIPQNPPSLDDMGLPQILKDFTKKNKGLIVVTGPTGSGKSTTLAAMLNEINATRRAHIITVEDPIEFLHTSKQSLVTQREVGLHTESFPAAIRSALRQDPDVILVGEMRDLDTVAAAITLAETGHLVLATLHTQDAPQTVDRIIDVFPPHQQSQIRAQLSTTLLGVVAQRLIPHANGKERVLALEILVRNDAITNCIKEGNTHQIYSMMQIGRADGMITLEHSLKELQQEGLITEEQVNLWSRDVGLKESSEQ